MFIFNPNLGVELRDQLLLKYKLEFENFGLFGIFWLLYFYWYINFNIWISFGEMNLKIFTKVFILGFF